MGEEENAVNGYSLRKFSDAECVVLKYNPAGRSVFFALLRQKDVVGLFE